MELPARFPYNPRWATIAYLFVIFGASSAIVLTRALTGSIVEDADGQRTTDYSWSGFYWAAAALSLLFVVLSILLAIRRVRNPQVIEFQRDALHLPFGVFQIQMLCIPYSSITSVTEASSFRQKFLYLETAAFFPNRKSYAAAHDFLSGLRRDASR